MTGSLARIYAMMVKELLQLARDRMTFAIMIAVPVMQMVLFGYAINTDPRHLPTAVLAQDNSVYARSLLAALQASEHFAIRREAQSAEEIDRLILAGEVQFAVEIPAGFGRDLVRGDRPQVLLIADATDPTATGGAIAALARLQQTALAHDLVGPLRRERQEDAFEIVVHKRYNPEGETSLNIVPGLVGTILTMTLVIFTALAVTREIERGTMENLLAMPIRPAEVMIGKIAPYVLIGALQFVLILVLAWGLFAVPVIGSLTLLATLTTLFIVANLSIGYTFSTVATNQLQAMQMSILFFLPSILLSGFMFPFAGMPGWAQVIGEVLPMTHFLRIVRGIMLKGADFGELGLDVGALGAFALAAMAVALLRFRRTLD